MTLVGAALVAILWPRPPDPPAGKTLPASDPLLDSPAADGAREGAPRDLGDLLARYLEDMRLEPLPSREPGRLVYGARPGRSLFQVHADLARAGEVWDGRVESGREGRARGPDRARFLDLRVTRDREERDLRLVALAEPPAEGRIALVLEFGEGRAPSAKETLAALPFAFTPAVAAGRSGSKRAFDACVEAGRRPLVAVPSGWRGRMAVSRAAGLGTDGGPDAGGLASILGEMEGACGILLRPGPEETEGSLSPPDLDLLASRGLYWLLVGTADPRGPAATAALCGVRCLTPDLILDGARDPGGDPGPREIEAVLEAACDLALSRGDAIVVVRARPATIRLLQQSPERIASRGCRYVRCEELLR